MQLSDKTIPIVIGVTGHRQIRPEDTDALRSAVKSELEKLTARYPSSPFVMLTSLAEGGDLICADAARELGIPIKAALPMELPEYERDFSPEAGERLRMHCGEAVQIFVPPFTEAVPESGPSRDFLFRQAGIYVAGHCHVMLALWDGGPGTDAACGTAEAVGFALDGSYHPEGGISMRSARNTRVIHVFTPRGEHTEQAAGMASYHGDTDACTAILRKTDEFNALASELPAPKRVLLPEDAADDPELKRMEGIYLSAAALSRANARRTRRSIALLAAAGTVITAAFLMYDELQAIWMILVCGAMLTLSWGLMHYTKRTRCHRRYIEYRALAECMRVQAFLRYAGSGMAAAGLLSWAQREDTAWIMAAMCAVDTCPQPAVRRDIRSCWVEGQRAYHQSAGEKASGKLSASERIVRAALIVSIAFYIAAVAFELTCGGLIFVPVFHIGNAEFYRTVLKIILGSISAVTLFVSSYYGRLSLSVTHLDHVRMERFFSRMHREISERGQSDMLLSILASEELTENGNWVSYQRDNTPDLSL